jgi:hypothetical protein
LQSAYPVWHEATWHAPAVHVAVPFAAKQAFPHPPQLSTLLDVLTSQPFADEASQSASGARQAETLQIPF